ncbi:MAG TPA: hypothetical protein DCZ94_22790 [Lentisphaeria bacterium]|nr:MAG: hypothetical protein A2X48_14030 [Lentisphaerae bacterium GWF2_49_21]HBC89776.1 hypothetical protein [Lentisphaeria bacterium]
MIKVNANQVDFNGIRLYGHEKVSEMEFEGLDNLVTFPEKMYYDLTVTLVNGGIVVSGKLELNLECTCGRCLKKYEHKIQYGEVCHFFETGEKSEIDLTPELREDILITFPQNFICSSDCKGLCPFCGGNRNVKNCRCGGAKVGNECWSELDKLDLASSKRKRKNA